MSFAIVLVCGSFRIRTNVPEMTPTPATTKRSNIRLGPERRKLRPRKLGGVDDILDFLG